jgi:ABC-2 type transport system permease protein
VTPIISQGRLFLRLRGRMLLNAVRGSFRKSRLRAVLIAFLSLVLWGCLYVLFADGFRFLHSLQVATPVRIGIVELLFSMFFLGLTALMVFSTALVMYVSLFRAADAPFLLSTPARTDHIFAYKFGEALLFGAWTLMLLGTPLLVAYGISVRAPWYFYVMLVPYLAGILVITAGMGGALCLWVVYLMPQRRRQALVGIIAACLLGIIVWFMSAFWNTTWSDVTDVWLRRFIAHLRPSQWAIFPSAWLTRGTLAAVAREFLEALFLLLVIWSNALFWYVAAAWSAKKLYRPAYHRVVGLGGARRRFGRHWLDAAAAWLLGGAGRQTRVFVLKDLRALRRDPFQWAQLLIMGGMLLIYFINIPRLPHASYVLDHRGMIGLLNLTVIALMLCTYTSRFVFPLMSMEGRNFWVLGLLPVDRGRLLWSKFAFAACVTAGLSIPLTLVSEIMLDLRGEVLLTHVIATLAQALGLSAISVGLGAYFLNLKETNQAKIATGFGGTVNLLVSLVFTVAVTALAAVPTFMAFGNRHVEAPAANLLLWSIVCMGGIAALGAAAVLLPLGLGSRTFRKMEF